MVLLHADFLSVLAKTNVLRTNAVVQEKIDETKQTYKQGVKSV